MRSLISIGLEMESEKYNRMEEEELVSQGGILQEQIPDNRPRRDLHIAVLIWSPRYHKS